MKRIAAITLMYLFAHSRLINYNYKLKTKFKKYIMKINSSQRSAIMLSMLIILVSIQLNAQEKVTISTETRINASSGINLLIPDNLTINEGAALELMGNMTISGNLINNAGNSGLTIKSDSEGCGSLIIQGTATENITVECFLTKAKWHYISEPVNTNGNFNTLNLGLEAGSNNDQFYRWEENLDWNGTVGNWVDILNGPNGNDPTLSNEGFIVGKGYDIFYKNTDKTLSLIGVPYTSNPSINITKTPNSTSPGWNLIGNPFCSTTAANSNAGENNFLTANANILNEEYAGIYCWNEGANYNGNRNDYTTISNSESAKYIDVGQAFMICKKDVGSTDLTLNTNLRKHGTRTFYKNSNQTEISRIYLSVENNEGLYNEILIAFFEGMTDGLDVTYDVGKLKGNPNIAFYSILVEDNRSDFIHQALPPLNGEKKLVKIGLDVSGAGNYTFKIKELENLDENITIKIEDKKAGKMIDFRETGEYNFNINTPGKFRERFVLHFNDATGIEDQTPETENIRFYVYDNKLYIIDKGLKRGTIQLFNILGQPVMEKRYSESVNTIDLNQPTGYYVVRIITDKSFVCGKVFVE